MPIAQQWLLILVFIAGLWVAIFLLVSRVGGWATLGRSYAYSEEFSGERWRFQSAQMRSLVGYNNCLTVGANAQGLYLSILFPFRIAHPSLFIPWREVSVHQKKFLWIRFVELHLGREVSIPLRISLRLAKRLKTSAGHSWPVEVLA